jgi:Raf kinase inhibitor-like YbhB/YbcL family protein
MKFRLQTIGLFACVLIIALARNAQCESQPPIKHTKMKITSTAFPESGNIPSQFTCDGADRHPTLHFAEVSPGAKSLVLIVDDPDAPSGLFTHWLVWNIDPKLMDVSERNFPGGAVEGTNDFGKTGYGGPCPPSGTHRYFFKIFALDRMLDLRSDAKRAELDRAMEGHIIAQGQLMGRYTRQK